MTKNRKRKQIRQLLLTFFAGAVVFVVTYALILPGVTLDEDRAAAEPGIEVDAEGQRSVFAFLSGKSDETGETDTALPAQEYVTELDELGLTVSVRADEGALPEGATMEAQPVQDAETAAYLQQEAEAQLEGEMGTFAALTIDFYDADSQKIDPLQPIDITITSDNFSEKEEYSVLQLTENQEVTVIPQVSAENADGANAGDNNQAAAEQSDLASGEIVFKAEQSAIYTIAGTETITVPFTAGDGRTYEVTVTYDASAGIPEGSSLQVSEVTEDDGKYEDYVKQTAEAIDSPAARLEYIKLLDISIVDENGAEVELNGPVDVQIRLMDTETQAAVPHVVHFTEENAEVLETDGNGEEVSFETEGFSVFAVAYTVDFHYEVDTSYGLRTLDFSIPGGGFVSLQHLVEVLGISNSDVSSEKDTDNPVENSENEEINDAALENEGVNSVVEETGINDNVTDDVPGLELEDYDNSAVNLNEIVVSDATREFVANVESVEFSNPDLVWVGKVEEENTVGGLKEANELECQYSAELTEEQIEEINAQMVEAGDWALISVLPFISEEELTVTMKDGEVFTIRVTDAQIKKTVIDAKGDTWEITVTYGEDAQIPDGAELKVREILPEDERYEEYYWKSVKKNSEDIYTDASGDDFGYAHIFDIEIQVHGQKIEPESNVAVTIKLLDTPQENATLRVVHFSSDGPEIISIEENKEKVGETELIFVTDEFSVYAVIEEANHGEPDLANRSVKISVGGYYLTNETHYYNENPWKIGKTRNFNEAAVYQFETTNTPGVYRVYTMIDGERHYMHINHHTGNPHSDAQNSACVNLTEPQYTMDLRVVSNADGTYGICHNDGGTDYYLNEWEGAGGTGFAAYADADGNGNSKLTFTSVPEDPYALESGIYIVLVKIDEYYYIVNNDGTLTSVEYNETTKQVKVENPMMWTYTGTNLYHNSDAVDLDGSRVASDFYYKYIDPSEGTGISEDDSTNTRREIAGYKDTGPYYRIVNGSRQMQTHSALKYADNHLVSNNGEYYIGVTEENGVLKLAGGKNSDQAVDILFASPTDVLPVDSRNHTVSHIDISIEGSSEIDVPLAYGKYYDADRNMILEVAGNKSVKLSKEHIGISTDDMKKATIIAYTKNANGQTVPIDNAFYITGYSANAATEYSTPQVRIEGSFKVADLDPSNQNRNDRLNNRIYYSVTAMKTVTFDLVDPDLGQLYDADGKKLSITIDIAFSASFDYWDERNECPPVRGAIRNWEQGEIIGGSGMDFVLGGDAEQAESNIVAIEIMKLVVDENGKRIYPSTSTPVSNTFEIYQDADGDSDSVIGMGIEGRPINVNYANYINLHSKSIRVGADGMGLVYDYDVTPGMYYIREDPGSVRNNIVDVDGESWEYVGTRIETESPWRDDKENDGKMHISETYTKPNGSYNSVPEVLGNYTDIDGNATWYDEEEQKNKPIRNGFLEFYVYNIYRPAKTDITLKKVDKEKLNDENPDLLNGASFKITKFTDDDFQSTDTSWGTSGSMTVSDDKNPDGTYTRNGTFVFSGLPAGYYQIEETRFPDGYIKLSDNPRFEIVENQNRVLEISLIKNPHNLLLLKDNNLTIIVGNPPGAVLPNTGGPGTNMLYLFGIMLTGLAGTGLVMKRRRRKNVA